MTAKKLHSPLGALLFLVVSSSALADGNPPFSAVCEDVRTHAYRDSTNIAGEPMGDSWSTEEMFNTSWRFRYEGGDDILIDGERGHVLAGHPGVLIVSDTPFSNGYGAGMWVYALHIGMGKAVASQVNAHGGYEPEDQGVKARSTELKCNFDID